MNEPSLEGPTLEERVTALEQAVLALAEIIEHLQSERPTTLQERSEAFLARIHGGR